MKQIEKYFPIWQLSWSSRYQEKEVLWVDHVVEVGIWRKLQKDEDTLSRAGEIAWQLKTLNTLSWGPEFGSKKLTSGSSQTPIIPPITHTLQGPNTFWHLSDTCTHIQVHTNPHKTYTQIINKDTLSSLILPFPYLKEPRVRPGEENEKTFCLILLRNCCQKSLSRNSEKLGFP